MHFDLNEEVRTVVKKNDAEEEEEEEEEEDVEPRGLIIKHHSYGGG